ncbi:MAG: LemA family protein, partial [Nitrospirae bacterium]|nr:LemA family protein [Nitrospirota bacterium]
MVAIFGLALVLIIAVVVLIIVAGIVIYNKLVRLRTTVKSSWSDIDVHLKKRYDLVPNLVETVKGYATHEKSVLENVTMARAAAMKASSPADKAKAENMFSAP